MGKTLLYATWSPILIHAQIHSVIPWESLLDWGIHFKTTMIMMRFLCTSWLTITGMNGQKKNWRSTLLWHNYTKGVWNQDITLGGITMALLDLIDYVRKKRKTEKNAITQNLYKTYCITNVANPKKPHQMKNQETNSYVNDISDLMWLDNFLNSSMCLFFFQNNTSQ